MGGNKAMKVGDRVRYIAPDVQSVRFGVSVGKEGVVVLEKGQLDSDGERWSFARVVVDGMVHEDGSILCDPAEVEIIGRVEGGFRIRPIGLVGLGEVVFHVSGNFGSRGDKALAALRELGWEICE